VASLLDAAVVAGIPILKLLVPSGRSESRNGGLELGTGRFRGLVPRGARALHRGGPVRKPRKALGRAPPFTGRDRAGMLVIRVSLGVRNGGTRFTAEVESNIKRAVSLAIGELTPTRRGERNGPPHQ
jgi:hypothetical protein